MQRFTKRVLFAPAALLVLAAIAAADGPSTAPTNVKTESFDRDPGWEGINNRSARTREPIKLRQDFGYSPRTNNAGGARGEIGGFISPAGEPAFYGREISPLGLERPLSASGTMLVAPGGTHLLLGFFNADTVNEWRTPNTVAIRINGRGDKYFAYVEYCTAKWRAGGDTTPFPSITDRDTGRWNLIGFPCRESVRWSLNYDPQGNHGAGSVRAAIGQHSAVCDFEPSHRQDGARFNRFGILNVMKSADSGSEIWLDDLTLDGGPVENFDSDPRWDGRNNRATIETRIVRPWFDFGHSPTNFAGGRAAGELGGQIFRGDCRAAERMACYGDKIGPLRLDKPLQASGKVAIRRGVSDSTTLFGFYNAAKSMRQNESQNDGVPECVLGIHIEGPSSEGFRFYPVIRADGEQSRLADVRQFPRIYPDGASHAWSLRYAPASADQGARIVVELDGQSNVFEIADAKGLARTTLDRFGIVTSWIDGNSQDVYWDDLSYTTAQD